MISMTILGLFFVIALAGVPLMIALLATTVAMIETQGLPHPLESIFLTFIGGVEPFLLIAVPLFIFAGELLSQGGVGKRMVMLARALLGFMPGGLGVSTVATCLMFGGVSGSAIADTAAVGSLTIPAMIQRGYSRAFAAALVSVAGTLALLMPLSIPFLVYAFISGVSMKQLSMAGVVPAFVTALALIAICIRYGRKTGCDSGDGRASATEIWRAVKDAAPALIMPLIIVGGIWSGLFTPTESAAVAVVYGLGISLLVYNDLSWRDLPRLLLSSFQTSAVVMLVIAATGCLSWLLTIEQVAVHLADWVKLFAREPWMFLLLVNVALLLLGIFIEPLPAMLLIAPLLLPLAKIFGVDLLHLGIVMTASLSIALYTPPVGGTLFVAAKIANAGIGEITRAIMPLMAVNILVVFLVTYVPALTRWLPALLG